MPDFIDVFISSAAEDDGLRKELEEHLALLKRDRVIRAWHARLIGAGEDWRKERDERLRSARVVVLLVSASYLASDSLYDEELSPTLARARKDEALAVPVLVRAHDWERAPFSGLTPLPRNRRPVTSWTNRDEAWADVATGIRGAVEALFGGPASRPAAQGLPPPEPRYEDDASRALAKQIEDARARRSKLLEAKAPTVEVDREILDLRRRLREGGRLRPGDTLDDGRYLLLDVIGKGGFASVWSAVDREGGEAVAIKVLHPEMARDASRRDRFFRGARVMAGLGHEAVVRVLCPRGDDAGYFYFVMELVAGGDLNRAVLQGRVTRERAVATLLDVGAALAEAHAKGIVHRDVKPANILLDTDGTPRLTDFDLAVADGTTGGTRTGAAMGSYLYMAPEQTKDAKNADARADVYGLGMTAMFCLHGGELPEEALRHPEEVIAGLPCGEAVKRVLTRAIEVKPAKRFADARAFCVALRDAAEPPPAPPAEKKAEPDAPRPEEVAALVAVQPLAEMPVVQAPPSYLLDPERKDADTEIRDPSRRAATGRKVVVAACALGVVAFGSIYAFRHFNDRRHSTAPDAGPTATATATATASTGLLVPSPPPPPPSPCPESMVLIPKDTFTMGSSDGDANERPPHKVTVSAFCMDKTEVTVEAYRKCVNEAHGGSKCAPAPTTVSFSGYTAADVTFWSQFCNGEKAEKNAHPINCVDWGQADAYCKWTGGYLPTEAQWEYAARGAGGRKYPWGDEEPGPKLLNACGPECGAMGFRMGKSWPVMYERDDGAEATAPVGKYPDGKSPFGVLDMAGNVWEWVADWYGPYVDSKTPAVDPRGPDKPVEKDRRVIRGGGWVNNDASRVRAAYRSRNDVTGRSSRVGFRCARGPNQ